MPSLRAAGARVLVPYLRGFGGTRFRSVHTMRSGQQAALGADLLGFLDAVVGSRPVVAAGFDWGGRAACVVAALWPQRLMGLVSVDGYNVQDLEQAGRPAPPKAERSYWYQYYLLTDRGGAALRDDREALCRLLWETWSPGWAGASAAFDASARSLRNDDFVDVVLHSYRHRHGAVAGDPRYDSMERALALSPRITVPAVVVAAGNDGVLGPDPDDDRDLFVGGYELVRLPGAGHNVPQEDPAAFAEAVLRLAP